MCRLDRFSHVTPYMNKLHWLPIHLFIYMGFNVAFIAVYVISQRVVLWAEETSTYSWVKVLYCKLPTVGKQLPTFPHKVWGLNHRPQRWEASVLPLHHPVAPGCPLSAVFMLSEYNSLIYKAINLNQSHTSFIARY